MKDLEDFIKENKDSFNSIELSDNHLNVFQEKLNAQTKSKNKVYWFAIAASFVFLIMLSFFVKYYISETTNAFNKNRIVSLSDISPKYEEVENFYINGLNQKISEFKTLDCEINTEQKNMVNTELKQLDIVYVSLQEELGVNQNDIRIINAMINNYKNRIQFLELVIDQIKENC